MGATINLDGVESWGAGAVLPAGWHDVRIESAEDGESGSGKPQVALQMSAISGEHAGYGVRDWLTLTPAALGRIRQFLEATGLEIPAGDFEFPTSRLGGRTVRVLVGEEPRKDDPTKTTTKVKAYVPAEGKAPASSGGASKPTDDIPF